MAKTLEEMKAELGALEKLKKESNPSSGEHLEVGGITSLRRKIADMEGECVCQWWGPCKVHLDTSNGVVAKPEKLITIRASVFAEILSLIDDNMKDVARIYTPSSTRYRRLVKIRALLEI